jgi:hypothetical protein
MPILFALFATLRGSPFADVPYTINLKVVPADQIAAIEPKPFNSASHSIFVTATNHVPVIASLEKGTKLGVGEQRWIAYPVRDELCCFLSPSEMTSDEHCGQERAGHLRVLKCESLTERSSLTTT